MILWRPTRLSRTNSQKICPSHYRGLECKSRKLRNTWSNRQIWPWSTERSRAKFKKSFAKRRRWSEQTPSSNNTGEDPTKGHHQMLNSKIRLIIFFTAKDREALYSQQKGAGCGSDYEHLIAKFWLKMKKVGKTFRPFRYDLNQIPYDK